MNSPTSVSVHTKAPIKLPTAAEIAASGAVSKFVAQLLKSVNTAPDDVCCWTQKGDAFIIADAARFINIHKKTTRFESLIRQLHYYGFIKGKRHGKTWHFSHIYFQRDKPWLLQRIVRQQQAKRTAKGKGEVERKAEPSGSMGEWATAEIVKLREAVKAYKLESGKKTRRIELLKQKVRVAEASRDRVMKSMQRKEHRVGSDDCTPSDRPSKRQKPNAAQTKEQGSNTDVSPSPASSLDYHFSQEEDRAKTPELALGIVGRGQMEIPRTLVRTKSSSSNFAGMFPCELGSRSSSTSSLLTELPREGPLSRSNSMSFNDVAYNMGRDMPTVPTTLNLGLTAPFFQPPSRVSRMKSFTRQMDKDASAALNAFVESSNESLAVNEHAGISSKVHTFMADRERCGDTDGAKSEVGGHGVLSDQESKQLAQLLVNSPQIKIEALINHIIQESHLSGQMAVPVAEELPNSFY